MIGVKRKYLKSALKNLKFFNAKESLSVLLSYKHKNVKSLVTRIMCNVTDDKRFRYPLSLQNYLSFQNLRFQLLAFKFKFYEIHLILDMKN